LLDGRRFFVKERRLLGQRMVKESDVENRLTITICTVWDVPKFRWTMLINHGVIKEDECSRAGTNQTT